MSEASTSINDVVAFLQERADENDLDTVAAAIKFRRKALREQDVAAVKPGVTITVRDIKPKYFAGLTGTVKTIANGRKRVATVTLDEKSTQDLARASAQFGHLAGKSSFDLDRIPLTCCKPVS